MCAVLQQLGCGPAQALLRQQGCWLLPTGKGREACPVATHKTDMEHSDGGKKALWNLGSSRGSGATRV